MRSALHTYWGLGGSRVSFRDLRSHEQARGGRSRRNYFIRLNSYKTRNTKQVHNRLAERSNVSIKCVPELALLLGSCSCITQLHDSYFTKTGPSREPQSGSTTEPRVAAHAAHPGLTCTTATHPERVPQGARLRMSREFDRGQLRSRHRAELMVRHPLDRQSSMLFATRGGAGRYAAQLTPGFGVRPRCGRFRKRNSGHPLSPLLQMAKRLHKFKCPKTLPICC